MKKSIYLLLLVPFLMLGCKQNNEPGEGDKSKVLGKSFKNYSVTQYSSSTEEYTSIVSFPHERVCKIYTYGTSYWYDGDVESGSFNSYYEYNVKGNEVILIDLDTEEESYRFKYQNGNLVLGSDVYVDNGTVEMDPSLDNRIPPEGKRSYVPVGWYDCGYMEFYVKSQASFMYAAGNNNGLSRLPQEIANDWEILPSAIRVADNNCIQTVFPAISLSYHNSYATQTYGNYIYYFYFDDYLETYKYRLIDGNFYLKNDNGEWVAAGTYDDATKTLAIGVPSGTLIGMGDGFHKINYNGDYYSSHNEY